ncbi:hypothetical protein PsorP6_005661 [Peronosclerospora sorghi]|uniref:Uncharacterized protein n=1 Tax=Peronosclerospora sorghi TaxID=230839 RepID=A0ACC0W303_9STRA|nr:hypothetical protein PsorP6_005661 [Peronosclerospora sorghi]
METPNNEEWKYQKELLGKASPHTPSVYPKRFFRCSCGLFYDVDDVPAGQEKRLIRMVRRETTWIDIFEMPS